MGSQIKILAAQGRPRRSRACLRRSSQTRRQILRNAEGRFAGKPGAYMRGDPHIRRQILRNAESRLTGKPGAYVRRGPHIRRQILRNAEGLFAGKPGAYRRGPRRQRDSGFSGAPLAGVGASCLCRVCRHPCGPLPLPGYGRKPPPWLLRACPTACCHRPREVASRCAG